MYMHVCMGMCTCLRCQWKPRMMKHPGVRVTGTCELPNVDAVNLTFLKTQVKLSIVSRL